ncbi:MAG: DUF2847 family protein [Coprobacillus sp.]
MEFIKKFAKEISVFGLVIVVFLGLFLYRQITFKDYTTITEKQLTQMVSDKEDFVVILGDSTDNTMIGYQEIMQKYTTDNRDIDLYYLDTKNLDNASSYVEKTFNATVSYPATLIVKDGKVEAKKDEILQYYSLYDFIKENFKK